MKVLWIIHGGETYGEQRAIRSLMQGVEASGWQVEAAALTTGECGAAISQDGIHVIALNVGDSPGLHQARSIAGRLWQLVLLCGHQIRLRKPMRRAIRLSGAEIVHVLDKNILPAVAWAARKERKLCIWEMTSALGASYPFDLNRRMHQWLVRRFDIRPLANSRYTAATLQGRTSAPEVMYLGSDPKIFDPDRSYPNVREALHIPPDAAVFTIIARLDPSKGQRIFLEAMLRVADPGVHLLLVGVDPKTEDAREIQRIIGEAKAEARVHIAGVTTEPEMYLAASDVVVNARVDAEPFGLSTIEGMMMGKPLLVHALGGPAETVVDNESGWHVLEATAEDFAAGIRRALTDKSRWAAMGRAGRARANSLYSLATQTQRYRLLAEAALFDRKNVAIKK